MKTITEQATENGRLTVEEIVNRDKTFRYMSVCEKKNMRQAFLFPANTDSRQY